VSGIGLSVIGYRSTGEAMLFRATQSCGQESGVEARLGAGADGGAGFSPAAPAPEILGGQA